MLESFAAFAVFAAVLTITPGLDTVLVLRTTAVSGRRAGFVAILGILLGCLMWAVVSALGVTAVLAASDLAFTALRIAGAAYLGYLGLMALWRARRLQPVEPPPADTAPSPAAAAMTPAAAFRAGLLANLLNPKIGVFYLSAMPQFLPAGVNALAGSLALAAIHVVEGAIWLSLVVLAVNRARRWLTRPTVRRRLDQLTGVAFLAFGLRLAFTRPA